MRSHSLDARNMFVIQSSPLFICALGGGKGVVPAKMSEGLCCLWSLSSLSLLQGNCRSLVEVLLQSFLVPIRKTTLDMPPFAPFFWHSGVHSNCDESLPGCWGSRTSERLWEASSAFMPLWVCAMLPLLLGHTDSEKLSALGTPISLQGLCCFLRNEAQASCALKSHKPIQWFPPFPRVQPGLGSYRSWVPIEVSIFPELPIEASIFSSCVQLGELCLIQSWGIRVGKRNISSYLSHIFLNR